MGIHNSLLFIICSITIFLFQSLLHLPIVSAIDRLVRMETLAGDNVLVSGNGIFTLGFFTIPSTNLRYLGIWITNEQQDMKVWVANRDIPIIGDRDGILILDDSQTLNVVNRSDATLFSVFTPPVGFSNNITVVMGNYGGLDVVDDESTPYEQLWESFDHPTDTLLPIMMLGYNLTAKQNWTLNSWLSDQFPATGAFTMRLEEYQNSPQLLIYRRGKLYWASGPWNETIGTFQYLSSVNGSRSPFPYNLSLISDASGMYFTFSSFGDLSSTLKLSPNGQFMDGANLLTKTPEFCYGYESDNGCVVSKALMPNCRGKSDSFQLRSGDWIGGSSSNDDNSSISHGDCMERCWNDCTCVGFNTMNSDGTGCVFWTANATFRVDESESDQTIKKYVLVSPKPPKKMIWRWILVFLASVITFVLAYLCYVRIKRCVVKGKENRRRDDIIHQLTGSNSFNYGDELERGIQDAPDVKIFSLKAILTSTNNFSNENKLGQGGYGPVYKGELSDGRKIAVKRLSKASRQGIGEFKNELILISKLQHINLVRLYGCCIHQEEKMLLYEFMPNKSLDFFLFDDDKKEKIDWRIRFKIIEGIAQGLLYLHKYSRMRVIHRDLKVSNVLLDENMNPKIADFGMARIFQQDVSEAMTKRVVGTYGYMAPEYTMHGAFSFKSDVFSFGVLILEIVSGKKNSSFHNLLRYAWELWKRGSALELKDEALGESYDVKQLLRAIHVGLLCVQENANDRPIVSEVISMLNNEIAYLPIPKQPAFFMHPDEVQPSSSTEHLSGNNIQGSVNGLTITTMEAR